MFFLFFLAYILTLTFFLELYLTSALTFKLAVFLASILTPYVRVQPWPTSGAGSGGDKEEGVAPLLNLESLPGRLGKTRHIIPVQWVFGASKSPVSSILRPATLGSWDEESPGSPT